MAIIINKEISASERYKIFLQITSLFLQTNLTKLEIDIINELYFVNKGELNKEVRKHLQEYFSTPDKLFSSKQLNNYIKALRDKKIILNNNLHPSFMIHLPEEKVFDINIKLVANK